MHRISRIVLSTVTPLLCVAAALGNYGSGETVASAQDAKPIAATAVSQGTAIAGGVVAASMAELCQPAAMQAIASKLNIKVTVEKLPANEQPGPFLEGGTRFTPARGDLPAYCQVTGSFVTNPATGKTANFLATLPMTWNRKYLQLGCGGHCGTFAVSDAASPTITITNQGKPGDSVRKGYASFATDEGHAGFTQGKWAITGPGQISQDYLDDYLYRSQKVLATMGKEFTTAFYAQASGTTSKIAYSYFCGCSGGGRDALVAAAYFPEAFDGIVSGSPYANLSNLAFLTTGASLATVRSPDANLPASLVAQISPLVLAKCDAVDGVKDGLIQNPMACDFRPEKDLPRCADNKPGANCFTQAQIESVSTVLTAATDHEGHVVQPGYSVSELQNSLMLPPANPGTATPWPDAGNPATGASNGMALLGDAVIRVFTHRNDPAFQTASVISFGSGGPGPITGFRVIAPAAEVAKANEALRMGIGDISQNAAKLIKSNHKMIMWVNLSDHLLTPYMSVNYYKKLAKTFGGYDKLHKNIRMFMLPGTAHCSGGGIGEGPGSFDALSAIEAWVEKGDAPDNLPATLYKANQFGVDFKQPLGRTMPLCKFPEMARYSGKGDVKDGANWSCVPGDKRMLKLGESGRQAGVID
ncbi:feruloyl esterase [Novosphingobium sp. PhB165]|uniref:tannase/feruloyl esterase family alpha/beta hydrolase n=1 Tax=Novosphingobium sp. PhB165 TaxID=2485105 RepID=UPI0010E9DB08|nr:tannase/feruloyl esterase family alpha/beta hydrolase [Novosphingobium sp. PhB165]TCM20677.1 feruloyl esterase [Novosphingobium sp. PhB165]